MTTKTAIRVPVPAATRAVLTPPTGDLTATCYELSEPLGTDKQVMVLSKANAPGAHVFVTTTDPRLIQGMFILTQPHLFEERFLTNEEALSRLGYVVIASSDAEAN